ncbi:hypothetical protein RM553_06305 [Zunongwangia sp. F363]|uniref:Lipoprotein n=1 Tax=Autumnicola tepida TaxID=3075595 RepID=A0ABU3C7X1_9FLAO|nr:hypothetical protein [Zunongwangia sp. F363]MDT0642440.1 hypothetical protein [Zunongwangia sp. F363]
MKLKLYSLMFFLVLLSCKNNGDNSGNELEENPENSEYNAVGPGVPVEKDEIYQDEENPEVSRESKSSPAIQAGNYIKIGENATSNCHCYCLDVKLTGTSTICLVENEMYINSRFEKAGESINIFYTGPSEENNSNELPWDQFDKNEPVAVLKPQENGKVELDWKGFSINGELAVDYAIYGKKALEGTYERKL